MTENRKSVKFPTPYIEINIDISEQELDAIYNYFIEVSKSEYCTPVSVRSAAFSGSTWIRFPNLCMEDPYNTGRIWKDFFGSYLKCERTNELQEFYNHARDFFQPHVFKVKAALEAYINQRCLVQGVEVNLMPAGGVIKEHVDSHVMDVETHRVHLVLKTNEDAHMICNGDQRHFPKGKCFIFNNKMPHSVYNNGATDRTHLVVDLLPV